MGHRLRVGLSAICLVTSLVAVAASDAAALSPSSSIFFYRPGHAATGTLKHGVLTITHRFKLSGGWTSAAASRDSLLLYKASTGKLWAGTFRGGTFNVKQKTTVLAGFTNVIASCDTVMFYVSTSGDALVHTGWLRDGRLDKRTRRSPSGIPSGYEVTTASCDTAVIDDLLGAKRITAKLSGHRWSNQSAPTTEDTGTLLAATKDSYLSYGGPAGSWGTATGGVYVETGGANDFASWTIIAGTADSILFYDCMTGNTTTATLVAGSYAFQGPGPHMGGGCGPRSWKIIVGGR